MADKNLFDTLWTTGKFILRLKKQIVRMHVEVINITNDNRCIASLATRVATALSFSVSFSLNLSVGQSVNPLVKYFMEPRR